jgi:DNA-binding NarL/FixJ family response regulator
MTIRVLVVDDQELVRDGLRTILAGQLDITVVASPLTAPRRSAWPASSGPM